MNDIAYLVTLTSIVGTLANSCGKRWCFYIWLCTNSFWCVHNVINGQYAQGLLYAFNFCTCILGLRKWKKPQSRCRDDCRHKTFLPIPELSLPESSAKEPQTGRQETPEKPEESFKRASNAISEFSSASVGVLLKILHRAETAPKYRTRKKNLSRLKREYRKHIRKSGGKWQ